MRKIFSFIFIIFVLLGFFNLISVIFAENSDIKFIEVKINKPSSPTSSTTSKLNNDKITKYYVPIISSNGKTGYEIRTEKPKTYIYSTNEKTAINMVKAGIYSNEPITTKKLGKLILQHPEFSEELSKNGYKLNPTLIAIDFDSLSTKITKAEKGETICNNKKCTETEINNMKKELEGYSTVIDNFDSWDELLEKLSKKDELNNFLKQYNDAKCGDTFIIGALCKHFTTTTKDDLIMKDYMDKINSINNKNKDLKSKNENLKNVFINNIKDKKIKDACEDDIDSKKCKDAINNCKGNECKLIKEKYDIAYGRTENKVDAGYMTLQAIFNPDQNALSAARLFGFEADYSKLPNWLGKSMPSSICEAKIDGYLDKKIEVGGGTTQYGSCSDDTNNKESCINIVGDLRAQMTKLSPDMKTQITYSAFIRAPSQNIKVLIAISYKLNNGDIKKIPIKDKIINISAGQFKNIYESIEVPINETKGTVNENSFKIYLLGVYSDKSIYLNLMSQIYLMTFDDRSYSIYNDNLFDSGNDEGHNESINSDSSNHDLTTDDMLSMIS